MVPADSDGISRVPPYSGSSLVHVVFAYRAVTFFGHALQRVQLTTIVHF